MARGAGGQAIDSFLGIGECMVELSVAGPGIWRQGFAGAVFNTLWYARAGLPENWTVDFHTAFGADPISQQMRVFIENAGIGCAQAPEIADRVPGLYAIHLDGAERSFSYWRDRSAARQMMRDPTPLWRKVARARLIYLSGISLAILPESDADTLLEGLRDHARDGALIAFDPNIRPRLWRAAETMKDVITRAASVADIVLPSFDDERAAFGDSRTDDTAARYLAAGAAQVVVKNGDGPVLVTHVGGLQSFPVPVVHGVVDTTAAGDAFNGTYLASYLQTGDVTQSVRAAQACSGAVVCRKGALVPFEDLPG